MIGQSMSERKIPSQETDGDGLQVVYETSRFGDVLRVLSDVDLLSAPKLAALIDGLAASEAPLVVDFTRCTYIDSTTLSLLARRRRSLGERFSILAADEGVVARILTISGLGPILAAPPELAAALAHEFGGRPPRTPLRIVPPLGDQR
jgi:anti-anti-sigma factor